VTGEVKITKLKNKELDYVEIPVNGCREDTAVVFTPALSH